MIWDENKLTRTQRSSRHYFIVIAGADKALVRGLFCHLKWEGHKEYVLRINNAKRSTYYAERLDRLPARATNTWIIVS
jgi:hypothetical protein